MHTHSHTFIGPASDYKTIYAVTLMADSRALTDISN